MNLFELINKKNLDIYTYTNNYKAGDIIFNAGDICDKIGYVVSGEATIITITHTEKEETISYLDEESIFGDLLIFASDNLYLGHCICKKDTTIRFISKSSLLELFKDKSILESYLNTISNKAQNIKKENKLLKHNNLEDRIIHYLLEESIHLNSNIIKIKNISTLANILSIPRESLSRSIRSLVNKKIILIKKSGQTCYIKLLIEY